MNTALTYEIESTSLEHTLRLGSVLGSRLQGGEVFELISDLGGGKTTLTKAIARGMGSSDTAGSPTFTLERVYVSEKLTMHHFDFYRLHESGIVGQELDEALSDPSAVVVVEWGEIVHDILPAERIIVTITTTSDTSRHLQFCYPPKFASIVEDLQ